MWEGECKNSSSDAKKTCRANILTRLSGGKRGLAAIRESDKLFSQFNLSSWVEARTLHVCITSISGVLGTGRRIREKKAQVNINNSTSDWYGTALVSISEKAANNGDCLHANCNGALTDSRMFARISIDCSPR